MLLILYQYNPLHIIVLLYNGLNHLIMEDQILLDTIYIIISPSTSTCSSCNVSSDTLMCNITELDHTINYTISVAAINCAGTGNSTTVCWPQY